MSLSSARSMVLSSTYILRFIEKKLGYKFNELEIDPKEMIENIQTDTLLVFSKLFPYQSKVDTDLFDYINLFYNRKRIHSTLKYQTAIG